MTFCVFRTDRIGDVLLTLPLAAALKRHDASSRVLFCARAYTADLLRLSSDVDEVIVVSDTDVSLYAPGFVTELRDRRIDVTFFAYPRPGLALAALRAGIPVRVGTAYRWFSPMFTHRRREHRRTGMAHESEYNLALLNPLGFEYTKPPPPRLRITDALSSTARELLAASGIREDERFVVLHPGSGGSAKDWPPEYFGELAAHLLRDVYGLRVLVTGTEAEDGLKRSVLSIAGARAAALPADVSLPLLAAVFERAALVVANSTGPLHLASAVGRPVIGLYPFLHQCHPRRWGPLGEADIFTPAQQSDCEDCARENCDRHDDMRRISVGDVRDAAMKRLVP
ncbi:MAG: glycosyltransferase family 9 protein [Bacteroidia bacterium]|nr:glycosyltransferase family 9 protein [Bacteroidia bacterium]